MFGDAPNSLAEPALPCSKDSLAPVQLCDRSSAGCCFHIRVGSSKGHGVHHYGGSPEAEAWCCPPSLDTLSALCLQGDSLLCSHHSAHSCPHPRAKLWLCPGHCAGEGASYSGTSAELLQRLSHIPVGVLKQAPQAFLWLLARCGLDRFWPSGTGSAVPPAICQYLHLRCVSTARVHYGLGRECGGLREAGSAADQESIAARAGSPAWKAVKAEPLSSPTCCTCQRPKPRPPGR